MKNKYTGLRRFGAASKNSLSGFKKAFSTEEAFRQEIFLGIFFLPFVFFTERSKFEIICLLLSMFIVLITELLNTAIEYTIDRISKDYHEMSGWAKDIASTAVFLALGQFILVWGIVFLY